MGIPSYFKHLTKKVAGLLSTTAPARTSWLCFDFNCLIYHVLQRPDVLAGGEDGFLDEIVRYMMKVVRAVSPAEGVYLAVDGVVPMAKIRQQRMRRFRGASEAATAASEAAASAPGFSRNAITPGTEFMRKLGVRLQKAARDHRDVGTWRLSLADERGEGEHKVLNFIRGLDAPNDIVIYGLDADLIVLSLIAMLEKSVERISLFREVVDGGEIQRDGIGEEKFHFFAVDCLAAHLGDRDYLRDYCNAMMLLGNDFLPTAMTFRIKEDGHDELCRIIGDIRRGAAGPTPIEGLIATIIERLAADEQGRFYGSCRRKLTGSVPEGEENGPMTWKGERIFFETWDEKRLRKNWRDIYYRECLGGTEKSRLVAEYWRGMRWVLDYYAGRPVDCAWMYAWHYPPLWEDLMGGELPGANPVVAADITPTEQLALVLPLANWNLLPKGCKERGLPCAAPEWFPVKFGVNHIGRRWLWECEPEIPIPTIGELRARLS